MSHFNRTPTSEDDLFERRSEERTITNRGGLIFFSGIAGVHSCCVRDATNIGASIRLDNLRIMPSEFGITFDGFLSTRHCRLVWRDGDFVGVSFET